MISPKELLEFIKERRSIRRFQDREINTKDIEMILEAGRWTPSASNKQSWQFIVIKKRELINELSNLAIYGKFIKKAPIVIAIIGKIKENPNWYIQDTSLASMNMMLMAWSLGIGSCWIGSLNRIKAKKILAISEDDFLLTVLPFGYIKGAIPKPTLRKNLDKITKEIL